ncbi:LysR substrate-binding domain-containing protein [Catenovulum sp. 2E275]|uniref:LysR family transcriptional regulator n=1 Tax=Catenovulum sp. 2E275 TaxID=2980497 RepID=UPI0021D35C1A|nr:LysR family transcriptional regulator [Catenovulum sp. 2E275]MCU4674173.1 LysR substrate-binding domain-containing protein [Catenovulum sp. 2E275]
MKKGLVEFIQVVEAGNFSAAAEKLAITRSRISQIISELEQSLGVALFKRSTRSIVLTSEGERFYQQVVDGFKLLDNAIDEIKTEQRSLKGTIKINSVGGYFGEQILAPKLFKFMQMYPDISIKLDFSSAHIDLIRDQYDLAVRMGDLPDSNLIARALAYYPSFVCATKSYLDQYDSIIHPRQLTEHNCLVGSMKKWRFINSIDQTPFDITVQGQFECANGHIAKQAALQGLGIIRLPSYYLDAELGSKLLVNVVQNWQAKGSQVSLVYPKTQYRASRTQRLIEFLCDSFSSADNSMPGSGPNC